MESKKVKKIILITAITLSSVIILGCTIFISIKTYINQYINDNYQRRTEIWRETANFIPGGGIVIIGDSHTEFFALEEYFPGFLILNRGIYGDTTYGVKKRLDDTVLNINPSKVFLLIGANDINKTNDKDEVIAGNIKEIARKIRNVIPNTKIYIQSLYPVNPDGKNSSRLDIGKITNERVSSINLLLKDFCDAEGYIYIDMFSRLIDTNGQLREEYTIEGLHLNAAGYRFVAQALRPYFEE